MALFLVLHLLTSSGSNKTSIYSNCLWDINGITRWRKKTSHLAITTKNTMSPPCWQASSFMFCFPRCSYVAYTMSFMPKQHAKNLYVSRFWTEDWLHKYIYWLMDGHVIQEVHGGFHLHQCVQWGVIPLPPTRKGYVSQVMAHPCCKYYGDDVFMLAIIHFVVLANNLWFHMYPQILISLQPHVQLRC